MELNLSVTQDSVCLGGRAVYFYIDPSVAVTLVQQYSRFKRDRERVHERRVKYAEDFLISEKDRSRTEMWDDLEERWIEDAPDLSHIVTGEDGAHLWEVRDVAVVLGRDSSTISRTLQALSNSSAWRQKLKKVSITKRQRSFFDEGIFDLILDFYESVYIQRFMRPRSGKGMPEKDRREVALFWNYLKEHPELSEDDALELLRLGSRPGELTLPQTEFFEWDRSLKDALADIFERVFTIRVGTLFVLLFGIYYETARHFAWAKLTVPVLCLIVFILALWMVMHDRPRRFNPASFAYV